MKKVCNYCKKEYSLNVKYSKAQQLRSKFCSRLCQQKGRIVRKFTPWNKGLKTAKPRKCDFCSVVSLKVAYYTAWNKLVCGKHYWHLRKYGKVKEINQYTPNRIVYYPQKKYCMMDLRDRTGKLIKCCIFSPRIWEEVKKYKWSLRGKDGYVRNGKIYLHHLALPKKQGFVVDHISGNTMDNTDGNLRYLTHKENIAHGFKLKRDRKGKEKSA